MTARPDKTPTKSLRDAYKVSGFRVRARIDSYDELDHPAFCVTLVRRSKKRCAAGAGRFAAAVTISAGDGRAILAAAIGKSISIFTCTESAQEGQNWTPIGGQIWAPIDNLATEVTSTHCREKRERSECTARLNWFTTSSP